MAGGGPPELFKIVRYPSGPADLHGRETHLAQSVYVFVSEADRITIAKILGITDPGEQKRMLSGAVYINPVMATQPIKPHDQPKPSGGG